MWAYVNVVFLRQKMTMTSRFQFFQKHQNEKKTEHIWSYVQRNGEKHASINEKFSLYPYVHINTDDVMFAFSHNKHNNERYVGDQLMQALDTTVT